MIEKAQMNRRSKNKDKKKVKTLSSEKHHAMRMCLVRSIRIRCWHSMSMHEKAVRTSRCLAAQVIYSFRRTAQSAVCAEQRMREQLRWMRSAAMRMPIDDLKYIQS